MSQILIIGPHPDDQELGMGGTIARLADQGHDVLLLDVTDGCPTPFGNRATRLREAEAACKALSPVRGRGRKIANSKSQMAKKNGAAGGRVSRLLLDLPNRRVEHTLAARHAVAGVIRAHQASIMFIPHPEDAHPDHLAVTRIAEDARFDAKLSSLELPGDRGRAPIYPKWCFYYYCSHLRRVPDPSFFFDINGYEDRKRRAILAYKSQFVQNQKNRGVPEWIAAQDKYFGSRIGTGAAEGFWTREVIGLSGFDSFVA